MTRKLCSLLISSFAVLLLMEPAWRRTPLLW